MNGRSVIGVCIPTRNQAEFIEDALASAFAQTLVPSDVVVSDDAGSDNTVEVVERFRQTLAPELQPRLRYDRSPVGLGIGGNFDRAVRLAQGDFVVKLDSDDILERDFVQALSQRLEAHPRAGWAHCNVLNIHPDGKPMGLAHTRKKTGFYAAADALPAYMRRNDTCHCVLLRKSAYLAAGGYRPEMKTCEDWLLWLEMLFSNWGYCFDERPLARMRKYEARPELMTKRRRHFIESVKVMAPHVENLCAKRGSEEALLAEFRLATAQLCISSACDEENVEVRTALFETAYEFAPTLRNRIWKTAGTRVSAGITRSGMYWAGAPRRWARWLVQGLRSQRLGNCV